MKNEDIKIRGIVLSLSDVDEIQNIVNISWLMGRTYISRQICIKFHWYQANGWTKDRACRDIMLTLEKMGLLVLPPPKKRIYSPKYKKYNGENIYLQKFNINTEETNISQSEWANFRIEMVRWSNKEDLWNYLVKKYHYKGHKVIVGRYLKYIIYLREQPICCIALGEASWHVKSRDNWIGWNDKVRSHNLYKVINNSRFLILPWVKSPNLASHILSRLIKLACRDWETYYNISPLLIETYVDTQLFVGTCYKASNWVHLGTTKGYSKKGNNYYNHQSKKDIYVYPLAKNAKKKLLLVE